MNTQTKKIIELMNAFKSIDALEKTSAVYEENGHDADATIANITLDQFCEEAANILKEIAG